MSNSSHLFHQARLAVLGMPDYQQFPCHYARGTASALVVASAGIPVYPADVYGSRLAEPTLDGAAIKATFEELGEPLVGFNPAVADMLVLVAETGRTMRRLLAGSYPGRTAALLRATWGGPDFEHEVYVGEAVVGVHRMIGPEQVFGVTARAYGDGSLLYVGGEWFVPRALVDAIAGDIAFWHTLRSISEGGD